MDPEELDLLVRTVVGEAAGQDDAGQAAVAHTILNRVANPRFPNSIRGVVTQPKQYSAWNPVEEGGNDLVNVDANSPEYQRALAVVNNVMQGNVPDPTGGATHYYAPAGMPRGEAPYWWADEAAVQDAAETRLGGHIFLTPGQGGQHLASSSDQAALTRLVSQTPGLAVTPNLPAPPQKPAETLPRRVFFTPFTPPPEPKPAQEPIRARGEAEAILGVRGREGPETRAQPAPEPPFQPQLDQMALNRLFQDLSAAPLLTPRRVFTPELPEGQARPAARQNRTIR